MTNGEPKGLRKQFQADTKLATFARRALITAVFAGAIAAAIVVPLDNARDKPRAGPDGITLTVAEANGRALFAKTCSTCHTLAAVQAVARIGPRSITASPPASGRCPPGSTAGRTRPTSRSSWPPWRAASTCAGVLAANRL